MKKYLTALAVLLMFTLTLASTDLVYAAVPNISKSYSASTSIPNGSLVSLVAGNANKVEPANSSNSEKLVGVAVKSNQSLLAVNPSSSGVQVAIDGTVNALVSNINGNISVGQEVAVSPFNGVGMKSDPGDRVIGTATTSFENNTTGTVKEQIPDVSGKKHTITVGYVKLVISIGTMNSSNFSIQSLQQYVEALTGRSITTLRLIISLVVVVIAMVSIITLVYASIYGSIVSIGRNPLARYAVFRTLTSVIAMVSLIGVIACATVYALTY